MSHDIIPNDRNIRDASEYWDSGIAFGEGSNMHALLDALLSEASRIDRDLENIYDQQHIDTATGAALEQYGKLVNIRRKQGEGDAKYRARVKANFAQARMGATWDDFVEFTASVLSTEMENIQFVTNYEALPATITVRADPSVYADNALTASEVADLLSGGVPAGHDVNVEERGTFRLKSDGDTDDASKGLTSDSISTGGTLAADVV